MHKGGTNTRQGPRPRTPTVGLEHGRVEVSDNIRYRQEAADEEGPSLKLDFKVHPHPVVRSGQFHAQLVVLRSAHFIQKRISRLTVEGEQRG